MGKRRIYITEAHDARLAAVRYYEQYGEPGKPMEVARQGARLFPLEGEAQAVLGRTQAKQNDYRGALKSYMRALDRTVLPNHRQEIEALIAALRAAAPDSLKGMFHPDSLTKPANPQRKQERP